MCSKNIKIMKGCIIMYLSLINSKNYSGANSVNFEGKVNKNVVTVMKRNKMSDIFMAKQENRSASDLNNIEQKAGNVLKIFNCLLQKCHPDTEMRITHLDYRKKINYTYLKIINFLDDVLGGFSDFRASELFPDENIVFFNKKLGVSYVAKDVRRLLRTQDFEEVADNIQCGRVFIDGELLNKALNEIKAKIEQLEYSLDQSSTLEDIRYEHKDYIDILKQLQKIEEFSKDTSIDTDVSKLRAEVERIHKANLSYVGCNFCTK